MTDNARDAPTSSAQPAAAPELVFCLVVPLGVDAESVADIFATELDQQVGYRTEKIHLTADLKVRGVLPNSRAKGVRAIEVGIELGNLLAEKLAAPDADAYALHAIASIFQRRVNALKIDTTKIAQDRLVEIEPAPRTAYVVRSLKRTQEVFTLRRTYDPFVVVVGVFATRADRIRYLTDTLREQGMAEDDITKNTSALEMLLDKDAREGTKFGQNMRAAFAQSDLFIDLSAGPDEPTASSMVRRFVRLLFQDRSFTPTIDEFGMFHARAAALRSSSPSLQVGASIVDSDGEVVSVGTNEVARAGGGYYWDRPDADHPYTDDHRDIGHRTGDLFTEVIRKRDLLRDTLKRLSSASTPLLQPDVKRRVDDDDLTLLDELQWGALKGSELMSVIEFQHPVHAEMAALANAHTHGASVRGCTLYTTAFPCHMCAKHIIASGISRVVYVEPYPKSRAQRLYPESICVDREEGGSEKINFEPFIGIGPNLYSLLFASGDDQRQDATGHPIKWSGRTERLPRVGLAAADSVSTKYAAMRVRATELALQAKLLEIQRDQIPVKP